MLFPSRGKSGGSLGYNLVKTGAISEKAFSEFLSQQYQVPAVDLDELQAEEHSVELIPSEVATKFQVVPVSREGRVLTVAMANPDNIFAIDDIKFITGLEVRPWSRPRRRSRGPSTGSTIRPIRSPRSCGTSRKTTSRSSRRWKMTWDSPRRRARMLRS